MCNNFKSYHRLIIRKHHSLRLAACKLLYLRLNACHIILGVFVICTLGIIPLTANSQPMAFGQKKYVGNVIRDGNNIRADFPTYWNQVTAENAGKWENVESSQGVYNWTQLDNIYNYAISHGYPYRHHTLVWGQQQPAFLSGLDSAQQYQEIVNWFDQSGQRYLSASFCDVVNEPLHSVPVYAQALGGSGTTGWDWVIKAFELARTYWPYRKLHLNEYGIINDGSANAQFIQIINLLKDRGLIDGIGVQGHRFEVESPSPATLKSNLDNLAATGLPVYITEFDLGNLGNSGTPNDSVQLALYQAKFTVIWEHPGVVGITLWGYVEGYIWQTTTYLLRSNGTERPALQWLRRYLATPLPPELVSPVGTTDVPRNPVLIWKPSRLASSYRLQVGISSLFSTTLVDTEVTDTIVHFSAVLEANTLYYWRISAANDSGVSAYSAIAHFTTGEQIVAVGESGEIPDAVYLAQNYPNPFNPSTTIEFSLPERTNIRLVLVDVCGQIVKEIAAGNYKAGTHKVDMDRFGLASGIYFYRLETGRFIAVKKLVLIK
jgi:endo-1,4-beta-xylanase